MQVEGCNTMWSLDCLSLVDHHRGVRPILISRDVAKCQEGCATLAAHWEESRAQGATAPSNP